MYFNDKEISIKLVQLEISNRNYVITLIDDIIKVIEKFDGRVLNNRLNTTLQKAIENNSRYKKGTSISYLYGYSTFRIEIITPDSSVYKLLENGNKDWYHIEDNALDICRLDLNLAIVDRRIVAETIIKDIKNNKQAIQQWTTKIEQGLLRIAEWQDRWREIEMQITELQKEIPYDIQRYFGMRFNLQQY